MLPILNNSLLGVCIRNYAAIVKRRNYYDHCTFAVPNRPVPPLYVITEGIVKAMHLYYW